jgi:hypothetical protein|tara:strand:+ start:313 stop:519 length:207 start_codon:yes stop_codon:yes gene_type:complete
MKELTKTVIILQDSEEQIQHWTDKINKLFSDNKQTKPCFIQVTSGDFFDEHYQPRQNKAWMEDNNGNT